MLQSCAHEACGTELMGATGLRTTDLVGFSAECRSFFTSAGEHIRGTQPTPDNESNVHLHLYGAEYQRTKQYRTGYSTRSWSKNVEYCTKMQSTPRS